MNGPTKSTADSLRALLAAAAITLTTAGTIIAAGALAHAAGKAPFVQTANTSKPTFNAYFPADFTNAAYQQGAVSRVSKQWAVPAAHRPARGGKTVVQSTIARDGSLAAVVVTMKSGSKEWDDAALAAVTKGAPFPAIPRTYAQSTIEVHWHFSAN